MNGLFVREREHLSKFFWRTFIWYQHSLCPLFWTCVRLLCMTAIAELLSVNTSLVFSYGPVYFDAQ